MGHAELATAILIGAVALIAAVTDLWQGKIYNWLTLPVLLAAPLWHVAWKGVPGLWFSLTGFGVTAAILLGMRLLAGKGLGGGDVKLLAALGALGGREFILWALLWIALVGGPAVAIPVMLRRGILGYTFKNLALNMASRYAANQKDVSVAQNSLGGKLPYGICIAIGVLVALFYPGFRY